MRFFFFFKQKTAYDMRISDWSSDVCSSDLNPATIGASRLLYGYLLRKSAEVWEYRPCRLHMKLIVIDDVVYIGSANFDVRSLFVNVELMVRIADAGFAEKMRNFLGQLRPDCEVINIGRAPCRERGCQ